MLHGMECANANVTTNGKSMWVHGGASVCPDTDTDLNASAKANANASVSANARVWMQECERGYNSKCESRCESRCESKSKCESQWKSECESECESQWVEERVREQMRMHLWVQKWVWMLALVVPPTASWIWIGTRYQPAPSGGCKLMLEPGVQCLSISPTWGTSDTLNACVGLIIQTQKHKKSPENQTHNQYCAFIWSLHVLGKLYTLIWAWPFQNQNPYPGLIRHI